MNQVAALIPFRPSELRVMRKRKKLVASKWAEKERVLLKGPSPGPWKNSSNPAMAGIMDMLCNPWVRVVVIMKAIQTGATDGIFCFLGREADYSNGSDSALVVLADEKSVVKHSQNRLIPMVDNSRSLSQIKSPKPDDTTQRKIKFTSGFVIEIGWASSEVSLASETYRIVIMDEYDKYKNMLNAKEAEGRTTTMEDRGKKVVKLSNPGEEGGPLDSALAECDIICDYVVKCPDCGKKQVMQWDNVRWPGQVTIDGEVVADPKRIRRERSAWYECPHCQSRWDDFKRDKALDSGIWTPREEIDRPYAVGFWFPAWISKFVPISEIVAKWLEAQDSPDLLRAWYNKQAGLPFSTVNKDEITDTDTLYKRRYQWWPEGATWRVPMAACLLIVSVDVQDNRLEVKVIALARGFQIWIINRHIIHGSPSSEDTMQQLDEYLARTWEHESGARLGISAGGVDTGGHFTRTMYAWLRKKLGKRIFGVKGASDHKAPLVRMSMPSAKQRRQVPILMINTTMVKNDIHAAYKTEEPGPGYIHLPDDLDYHYFEQLTAEKPIDQRDKRGNKVRYWVKKKPSGRNEALDLLVYGYAVTHYINPDWNGLEASLNAQHKKLQTPEPTIIARTIEKPESRQNKVNSLPGWFKNRR